MPSVCMVDVFAQRSVDAQGIGCWVVAEAKPTHTTGGITCCDTLSWQFSAAEAQEAPGAAYAASADAQDALCP